MLNVKDLGAKGNGTTDDTEALQNAINGDDRHIYFPKGRYLISSPISFETPNLNFHYEGEPGAGIVGNFPDALFKRSVKSPIGGVHVIEKLIFENGHKDGKCLMLHSCVTAEVSNCGFQGQCKVGIETFNSQCLTMNTCYVIGIRGVGVMAGNATALFNCDITGCNEGVRHQNLGLTVMGGRYEVNGIAFHLGQNEKGETFQSTGAKISGLSMESNDYGIYVRAGASIEISGNAITNNTPDKHAGLYVHDGEEILFMGNGVSSGTHPFLDAAIYLNNPKQSVFLANRISVASGKDWRMPESLEGRNLFFAANLPPAPGA
jgi:parallel beta-helix repeat protein